MPGQEKPPVSSLHSPARSSGLGVASGSSGSGDSPLGKVPKPCGQAAPRQKLDGQVDVGRHVEVFRPAGVRPSPSPPGFAPHSLRSSGSGVSQDSATAAISAARQGFRRL